MRFVAPQTRITRENFCVADYHSIVLQLSGRFLQPIASIMRQVDVAAQVKAIPESLVYYKHRILEILLDSHQSNWESIQILCTHSNVVQYNYIDGGGRLLGDPPESYSDMKFVFRYITNPTTG